MTGLQEQIDALRGRGAGRIDPVRLAQLDALARRLAQQPGPVRAVLEGRIDAALAALAQQLPAECSPQPARRPGSKPAPRQAGPGWPVTADAAEELASVTRFRKAWSTGRAHDSVARVAGHRPANAGPLNSHLLASQSLDLMQQLPGDYLRHFVSHLESLLWLEDAAARLAAAPAAKGRRPGGRDSAPRRESARLSRTRPGPCESDSWRLGEELFAHAPQERQRFGHLVHSVHAVLDADPARVTVLR